MRVAHRHFNRRVTKKLLQLEDVLAGEHPVARERVPEIVERDERLELAALAFMRKTGPLQHTV